MLSWLSLLFGLLAAGMMGYTTVTSFEQRVERPVDAIAVPNDVIQTR